MYLLFCKRETGFCTKDVSFECLVSVKIKIFFFLVDEICPQDYIEVLSLTFFYYYYYYLALQMLLPEEK